MKIIINQNERGLLFKNGVYVKMLKPGKNKVRVIRGETFVTMSIDKPIITANLNMEALLNDAEFASEVLSIVVPDGFVAVRYEQGRVVGAHKAGKYYYFNCFNTQSYQLFDTSSLEIEGLTPAQINCLPNDFFVKIIVSEGAVGLLKQDGKLVKTLQSGGYYFWKTDVYVSYEEVDLRSQELEINGQEILTADKVSLRVNFVANYKITDAVRIVSEIKNYKDRIYTAIQLALREYIGKFRFDELLEQKDSIACSVLTQLQAKSSEYCVEFVGAGLKDIILPGEIRDIMNTVLVAEKNAQANVIARREEVASTRSLLNTAKLLDENATLYKLKELEYLERICDKVGTISVGGGNLLGELQKIISVK